MKLSEEYDEIKGTKLLGGRALRKRNIKPEVAKLEAENEAYKWLIRKLPLRLFDEIADKSPPHIWKHFYSDGPGVEDD